MFPILKHTLFTAALIVLLSTGTIKQTHAVSNPLPKFETAIAAFIITAASSYIALIQDEQHELQEGNILEKMINWYRRVICGRASKKVQVLTKDDKGQPYLKDTYTPSSGLFGKLISWYDANEKDVKKSAGLGVLTAGSLVGVITLKNIIEWFSFAPTSEFFKKIA